MCAPCIFWGFCGAVPLVAAAGVTGRGEWKGEWDGEGQGGWGAATCDGTRSTTHRFAGDIQAELFPRAGQQAEFFPRAGQRCELECRTAARAPRAGHKARRQRRCKLECRAAARAEGQGLRLQGEIESEADLRRGSGVVAVRRLACNFDRRQRISFRKVLHSFCCFRHAVRGVRPVVRSIETLRFSALAGEFGDELLLRRATGIIKAGIKMGTGIIKAGIKMGKYRI